MATGRFAPSPTGDLHVGNLRTALLAWLFARASGGRFLFRYEDLDTAFVQPDSYDRQAADLRALGLDWDGEAVRQSDRIDVYRATIHTLVEAGLTYPCWCSRREIREAAGAPHGPPGAYPGTCRNLSAREKETREASGRPAALRMLAHGEKVTITDRLRGDHTETIDDFVLKRGDGTPAYHLVVVIDDAWQGVEEVVRADDLLSSTPRHAYLADQLGLDRPTWAHVPLALSERGGRLAKRDGSVTLEDRRALGDTPERVRGYLAASVGLAEPGEDPTIGTLLDRFEPTALWVDPWVLTDTSLAAPW